MKIVPLNDKIVVERLEAEDKTAGGIILPDTAKEKPKQGEAGRLGDYERLLGDAMEGDPTLFARYDTVEAAWRIVEPVIHGPSDLWEYEPGSWGPSQADWLVADVGGWHSPE